MGTGKTTSRHCLKSGKSQHVIRKYSFKLADVIVPPGLENTVRWSYQGVTNKHTVSGPVRPRLLTKLTAYIQETIDALLPVFGQADVQNFLMSIPPTIRLMPRLPNSKKPNRYPEDEIRIQLGGLFDTPAHILKYVHYREHLLHRAGLGRSNIAASIRKLGVSRGQALKINIILAMAAELPGCLIKEEFLNFQIIQTAKVKILGHLVPVSFLRSYTIERAFYQLCKLHQGTFNEADKVARTINNRLRNKSFTCQKVRTCCRWLDSDGYSNITLLKAGFLLNMTNDFRANQVLLDLLDIATTKRPIVQADLDIWKSLHLDTMQWSIILRKVSLFLQGSMPAIPIKEVENAYENLIGKFSYLRDQLSLYARQFDFPLASLTLNGEEEQSWPSPWLLLIHGAESSLFGVQWGGFESNAYIQKFLQNKISMPTQVLIKYLKAHDISDVVIFPKSNILNLDEDMIAGVPSSSVFIDDLAKQLRAS